MQWLCKCVTILCPFRCGQKTTARNNNILHIRENFQNFSVCSVWDISESIDKLNKSKFLRVRRLNIKWCFNWRSLWGCYRCYLNCFLLLGQWTSRLTCLWAFVCFALVCLNTSAVRAVVVVCAGDIHFLFKLLLKCRNVLRHTESRSSLKYQRRHPHSVGGFPLLSNETKRHKQILHGNIHATREWHPRKNHV